MATLLTARDWDIFRALARCPLTIPQLQKASATFSAPFRAERRLQRRMQALAAAELVRQWRYATAGPGAPSYFTLAPESYRLLHGHDAALPGHRAFEALSTSRQSHTRSLADFIVHTAVAAHRTDCIITDFHREGSLRLQVGTDFLYPDCAFWLTTPDERRFEFFVELDNATEAVRTDSGIGSFERKVRFYEAYKDQCKALGKDYRFRVVLVTTGGKKRLENLLDRSKELVRVKHRPLVCGITLDDYLACASPLNTACFRDNCHERRALVPKAPTHPPTIAKAAKMSLAPVAAL